MRDLVLTGGPWTEQQRRDILAYCQGDVDCLGPLLERMLPRIAARPRGMENALLRGAYMKTVAVMEHNGVPIDTETLDRLREHWTTIKAELIREVDRDYHVYDDGVFRAGWFAAYLARVGIHNWPRSDTGKLLLDKDTFKAMAESYPCLRALRELRVTLSELRLEKLQVGPRRPQPGDAESVRGVLGAQHAAEHQVHLRSEHVAAQSDQTGGRQGGCLYRLVESGSVDRCVPVERSRDAGRGRVGRSVPVVRDTGWPGTARCDRTQPPGDSEPLQGGRVGCELRDAGAATLASRTGCQWWRLRT